MNAGSAGPQANRGGGGDYRQPAPPTALATLPLRELQPRRLYIGVFGGLAVACVFSVTAINVLPGNAGVVAAPLFPILLVFFLMWGLLTGKVMSVRFLLEIGEMRVRLLTPAGVEIASTTGNCITFQRVNYTRRTKSAAYLRPGFRMRLGGETFLIGTLLAQDTWTDNREQDPGIPIFELKASEFDPLRTWVLAQEAA
jgi:hypothetical protein